MKYEAEPTPLFRRQFKKLHKNEQEIIVKVVEGLRAVPNVGEPLKGVLRSYTSVEIEHIPGNFRLIFKVLDSERVLHLIAVGPHRTIYYEATRYIKEAKLNF
jgi:mRNA-degrading endonuclease RelE of RelBE toxin-antitoxin system